MKRITRKFLRWLDTTDVGLLTQALFLLGAIVSVEIILIFL